MRKRIRFQKIGKSLYGCILKDAQRAVGFRKFAYADVVEVQGEKVYALFSHADYLRKRIRLQKSQGSLYVCIIKEAREVISFGKFGYADVDYVNGARAYLLFSDP